MARTKAPISITLSHEIITKLDEISEQMDLSRSALVENILKQAGIMKFDGTLREGTETAVSPSSAEQWGIIQDLFSEVELLKERMKKLEVKQT